MTDAFLNGKSISPHFFLLSCLNKIVLPTMPHLRQVTRRAVNLEHKITKFLTKLNEDGSKGSLQSLPARLCVCLWVVFKLCICYILKSTTS